MNWDWQYTGEFMPDLLDGLRVTVTATILGYLLALVLGLVWTGLRRGPNPVVSHTSRWVMEFIRSTPLFVQLYILYFVLPVTVNITMGALTAGIIGLGLHYSTYTSEVYRAGIANVPKGQWEACTALNLPRSRTWRDVVLPQAIRSVVPTLGNYLIAMFKDTPYLLGITVMEMMNQAFQNGAETLKYLEPITVVGLLFIAVSVPSSILVRRLEKRYATY